MDLLTFFNMSFSDKVVLEDEQRSEVYIERTIHGMGGRRLTKYLTYPERAQHNLILHLTYLF